MNEIKFGGWYVDDDGIRFIAMTSKEARLRVLLTFDVLLSWGGTLENMGDTFEANQRVIAKAALDRFVSQLATNDQSPHVFTLDRQWMDRYLSLQKEYHAGAPSRLARIGDKQEAFIRARVDEFFLWASVERATAKYLRDGSSPPAEFVREWSDLRSKTEKCYGEWLSALSSPHEAIAKKIQGFDR